ncbi:hypothetical protein [Methanolobus sp. WCC4]|uniref:hypothetical protein n=1 Tax=Methanolobus sp. WCC4 TaxID=3125784 RepID=UPI0030F65B6D
MKKNNSNVDMRNAIQMIHGSPHHIVLIITGGGTEAIGELLRHGKGSTTLLEANVPYSREALIDLIGKEPSSYASPKTAKDMAMSAYRRALFLNRDTERDKKELIGIGVTCKLTKGEDERKGRKHEVHLAYQSYNRTGVSSFFLKESATREEQEKIAATLIIDKIADICALNKRTEMLPEDVMAEETVEKETEVSDPVAELLLRTLEDINSKGHVKPLKVDMEISSNEPKIILSGSFNPCHKNHIEMAGIASGIYNAPVDMEISLANVDKPPIDLISLEERIDSIMKWHDRRYMGNIYLTNSPLFADKAVLFPNCIFIIGTDTLNRLFNKRYYRKGEDTKSLVEHFKRYNVRFVVFIRKGVEISKDIEIPDICDIVPLEAYMDDGTSSTKIRERNMDQE